MKSKLKRLLVQNEVSDEQSSDILKWFDLQIGVLHRKEKIEDVTIVVDYTGKKVVKIECSYGDKVGYTLSRTIRE